MKTAIKIFLGLAGIALLIGMMSCGMARQLHWQGAEVAGVYECGVSAVFGLIAAALYGFDWVRKNVRIQ
jgi:hypothetical protein